MTSDIIDESAIADALRLGQDGERAKQILSFQGLGLWHGDLAEMRRDSPRRPAAKPAPPSPGASEVTRRMAMIRRMADALKRLPPQHREVLHLRYYEGLTIGEAADRLGVTTGYAEELIHQSLQRVRENSVDKHDES